MVMARMVTGGTASRKQSKTQKRLESCSALLIRLGKQALLGRRGVELSKYTSNIHEGARFCFHITHFQISHTYVVTYLSAHL